MNAVFDAGQLVPSTSSIHQYVRPIQGVPAGILANNLANAARADADTAREALWLNHLETVGGSPARRDSLARELAPLIVGARQDSGASLLPTQGKIEIGAPIVQRLQDRADILEGIPARPVDGNASGYYRNYIKPGGVASLIRGDGSQINRVSYTVSQDLRPLHWCGVALANGWLEQRRTAQAGVEDARWKMEAVNRAIRDFWWNALVTGSTVPGLDFYSIASVPGVLRYYSSVILGSAPIANVLTELVFVATQAQERSPANLAPDRAIIPDRLRNRLLSTTAAPYSPLNAWDFFTQMMNGLGIQVVIGKSLRDFEATGVDGMLFFRSDANEGLRRVTGLDVTPVHTYLDASGQVTIYASSGGGLELPYAEGCLLALFPYS